MNNSENSEEQNGQSTRQNDPIFTYDDVSRYRGVGGWLLLLCVGLTIIGPLVRLSGIGSSMTALPRISALFPLMVTLIYAENICSLIIGAFSVYAGYSLWAVKSNAVYKAKAFLVALVIFAVFDLFLIYMTELPAGIVKEVSAQGIFGLAQSVIYAGVWFAYLSQSKRVRATYGEPFQEF
jgi:hypothetical protein